MRVYGFPKKKLQRTCWPRQNDKNTFFFFNLFHGFEIRTTPINISFIPRSLHLTDLHSTMALFRTRSSLHQAQTHLAAHAAIKRDPCHLANLFQSLSVVACCRPKRPLTKTAMLTRDPSSRQLLDLSSPTSLLQPSQFTSF